VRIRLSERTGRRKIARHDAAAPEKCEISNCFPMVCEPNQTETGPRKNIGLIVPVRAQRQSSFFDEIALSLNTSYSKALPEGEPPKIPMIGAANARTRGWRTS